MSMPFAPLGASLSAHPTGTETSDRAVSFHGSGFLGGPVPTLIHGHDEQHRVAVTHAAASPLSADDVRALAGQGLCAWQIAKLRGCLAVHVVEVAFAAGIPLRATRQFEQSRSWRSGSLGRKLR